MRRILLFTVLLSSFYLNAQVFEDAIDIKPLKVGEFIPDIEVSSVKGESVSISDLVKSQKTVLVFFRGGWCPYCNKHLSALGAMQEKITELGYKVIAVSPDSSEKLSKNIDRNNLNYELYSDSSTALIQAMGLAIKAADRYTNTLLNFSENQNSDVIPVPAVFLLSTNGEVLYNYTNPNYKERLEEKELLKALTSLN